jgi:hypothetical protein
MNITTHTPCADSPYPWLDPKLTRNQSVPVDKQQPTLLRRLACEGCDGPINRPEYGPEWLAASMTLLNVSPIIVADEACGGFMQRWQEPGAKPTEAQTATLSLPFPFMWIETHWTFPGTRVGMLMTTAKVNEDDGSSLIACFGAISAPGHRPVYPLFAAQYEISKHGLLIEDHYHADALVRELPEHQASLSVRHTLMPFWAALGLMNCSNIELDTRDLDANTGRRMAQRFGERPEASGGYRFHTISIRPMRKGHRRNGESAMGAKTGLLALHLVRGHFARYGPQFNRGLLFGKYPGEFWIQPHARGDEANGIVGKDYALAALGDGDNR